MVVTGRGPANGERSGALGVIVLFDVDGTLLEGSATTHVRAFADALRETTGAPDPFVWTSHGILCDGVSLSGRIDREIARLCLGFAGVAPAAIPRLLPTFMERTAMAYEARIARGETPGTVLSGVVEVLGKLRRRGACCGLLTGNTRKIAYRKMSETGLGAVFGFGGFGDEGDRRADLFPLAIGAAFALGVRDARLCYVGDTPLDVSAAHEAGVAMVAMATGRFSRAELEAAGARAVLESYGDAGKVCDTLLAHAAGPPATSGSRRWH